MRNELRGIRRLVFTHLRDVERRSRNGSQGAPLHWAHITDHPPDRVGVHTCDGRHYLITVTRTGEGTMTTTRRPNPTVIEAGSNPRTDVGALESMVLMVDELPEADGDATERILAQLLAADTPHDLNRPWEASGIEAYLDRALEIRRVTRAPSDFEDGIGVYVVIEARTIGTGREVVVTTGSTLIIAQLIMATRNRWLPIVATPRGPKRPSKSGRTPYHLEFSVVAGSE